jgi:hypothetical protein
MKRTRPDTGRDPNRGTTPGAASAAVDAIDRALCERHGWEPLSPEVRARIVADVAAAPVMSDDQARFLARVLLGPRS